MYFFTYYFKKEVFVFGFHFIKNIITSLIDLATVLLGILYTFLLAYIPAFLFKFFLFFIDFVFKISLIYLLLILVFNVF
jgi:hypothetical protein